MHMMNQAFFIFYISKFAIFNFDDIDLMNYQDEHVNYLKQLLKTLWDNKLYIDLKEMYFSYLKFEFSWLHCIVIRYKG